MVVTGLEGKGLEASEGYCISGGEKRSFFSYAVNNIRSRLSLSCLETFLGADLKTRTAGASADLRVRDCWSSAFVGKCRWRVCMCERITAHIRRVHLEKSIKT